MVESDTIKLLRECDAGVKMGISSINDILDNIKNTGFEKIMKKALDDHMDVDNQIKQLLKKYKDDGKKPQTMAKSMSWLKTNVMLTLEESDNTVADLMTDGCNMGVKSLNKYLNEYKGADEASKDIAKKLINLEEKLAVDIRQFL